MIKYILLILLLATTAEAKHIALEKVYQDKWCDAIKGQTEVVMKDGTRCDCVTDKNAVEFDFGIKWAESLGQALNYSFQTGLRGGIVLILERPSDIEYYTRVKDIIKKFKLPIDVWIIKAY